MTTGSALRPPVREVGGDEVVSLSSWMTTMGGHVRRVDPGKSLDIPVEFGTSSSATFEVVEAKA